MRQHALSTYHSLTQPGFEAFLVQSLRSAAELGKDQKDAVGNPNTAVSAAATALRCDLPAEPSNKAVVREKPAAQNIRAAYEALTVERIDGEQEKVAKNSNYAKLRSATSVLLSSGCQYLSRKHTEYKSILDNVVAPLDAVLARHDNFDASQRSAPFLEPTQVNVILHRKAADPKNTGSVPAADGDSAFRCEIDPDSLFASDEAITNLPTTLAAAGTTMPADVVAMLQAVGQPKGGAEKGKATPAST